MGTNLRLAWRNIWRNKRRTLITAASVFLAVFLALVMRSMQIGTYARMTDNIVHAYTGYIQVHKKGYWEEKDINNSFRLSDTLMQVLERQKNVRDVIPRLESFALASFGPKTKGVMVVGTDPVREDNLTGLQEKIIRGRYLSRSGPGVLVAKKLAEYLDLNPGDTLVLIGQGYHGSSAAGKWPVTGIVHFSSPDLDRQMVYLPLPEAQAFSDADNQVTSLVLNLADPGRMNRTKRAIEKSVLSANYEVMSWDEMLVEVVQHIEADSASGQIMIGILYMIIGFGIFGTILMMTAERIREFGVMVSLGTQKARLAVIVVMESIFIGFLGVLTGAAACIPLILYFSRHPIPLGEEIGQATESYGYEALLCFEPPSSYFLGNALVVLAIIFLAAIYPVRKILRMNLINALRNKG
jgi:ABC-type lipoprotein release transport system permease subunit